MQSSKLIFIHDWKRSCNFFLLKSFLFYSWVFLDINELYSFMSPLSYTNLLNPCQVIWAGKREIYFMSEGKDIKMQGDGSGAPL